MRKGDYIFLSIFIFIMIFLGIEVTRNAFLSFTSNYDVLGGFLKFFLFASMGDLLGARLKNKKWVLPVGFIYKMIVWGLIGISIVFVFQFYHENITEFYNGVSTSNILIAFTISFVMNFTFAPLMMAFHRFTDTLIEAKVLKKDSSLKAVFNSINWKHFKSFVIFKTIPLFWVPAHTITFLLPAEFRVLFAAILGICLGFILAIANNKKQVTE